MENDDFGRPSHFQLWLEAQRFRFGCVPALNVPHNYVSDMVLITFCDRRCRAIQGLEW